MAFYLCAYQACAEIYLCLDKDGDYSRPMRRRIFGDDFSTSKSHQMAVGKAASAGGAYWHVQLASCSRRPQSAHAVDKADIVELRWHASMVAPRNRNHGKACRGAFGAASKTAAAACRCVKKKAG